MDRSKRCSRYGLRYPQKTKLDITIIGTRGIPASYGGFETFAEQLCLTLKKIDRSINLTVVCDRKAKETNKSRSDYEGVNLVYSKFSKDRNPILYYLDSILLTLNSSSITISCGLGGGPFLLIPKIHGGSVLTNPDGLEWKRKKWSTAKVLFIKLLERLSANFSSGLICDSEAILSYFQEKYKRLKLFYVPYGTKINPYIGIQNEFISGILSKYGLERDNYHLIISRLEPENNLSMIIRGYKLSKARKKLVIVGNIMNNEYCASLLRIGNESTLFLGGIYEKEVVSILRANAYSYWHGHSVGGTNPSLLEAMGSGNLCVCHDNVFNRSTLKDNGLFFKNTEDVKNLFEQVENCRDDQKRKNVLSLAQESYTWERIAGEYRELFTLVSKKRGY